MHDEYPMEATGGDAFVTVATLGHFDYEFIVTT